MEFGLSAWQLVGTILGAAIIIGAILLGAVIISRKTRGSYNQRLDGWGYYRHVNKPSR